MPDKPTYCVGCDLVHPDTRKLPPYQWRCMAYPAEPAGGFVDPDYRPSPPYHKCERANDGECEFWTPLRKVEADDGK